MKTRWLSVLGSVLSATLLAACAGEAPIEPPAPSTGVARGLDQLSAPLDLQQVDVTDVAGYRAVFLKLSRLPGTVTHRADSDPGRITLDIQGPTPGETEEQSVATDDALVWQVRISSQPGNLRVVIDLRAEVPPAYVVQTLADWVMVRFQPAA